MPSVSESSTAGTKLRIMTSASAMLLSRMPNDIMSEMPNEPMDSMVRRTLFKRNIRSNIDSGNTTRSILSMSCLMPSMPSTAIVGAPTRYASRSVSPEPSSTVLMSSLRYSTISMFSLESSLSMFIVIRAALPSGDTIWYFRKSRGVFSTR